MSSLLNRNNESPTAHKSPDSLNELLGALRKSRARESSNPSGVKPRNNVEPSKRHTADSIKKNHNNQLTAKTMLFYLPLRRGRYPDPTMIPPRAENDSARGRPFIIRKDRGPRAEWFQLEVDTLFFPWVHQSPKAKSFKRVRPRAETVSARGRSGLFWASVSPGSIIASRPRASYTFDLELKVFQLEVDAGCSGPQFPLGSS
ncbi:hypothetical protein PGTUg99_002404 [Puccinia graminis f. sp. tritici]|uniref:Uncharacterized protein n=1 Tax=Puccinia graminis f. sp. tritici TaxID=56615 RepID=A0A5B0QLG4_PUCGR|nr:hypothetical protein PGTUg99_002404 [Puccinia graminis f. sp. tritici]